MVALALIFPVTLSYAQSIPVNVPPRVLIFVDTNLRSGADMTAPVLGRVTAGEAT